MTTGVRFVMVAGLALATAACGNKTPDPAAVATGTGSGSQTALPSALAGSDWTKVTAATPEGGFRIGNPDAKVKLLEFASLTCPHCKDFHESAMTAIRDKYVASGNVSYEFRNFVLNGPDYAASLLARCQGAEPFFGLLASFYADQTSWVEPFAKLSADDNKRIAALPEDQQIAEVAKVGKLDEYVRARGIPLAKFNQCLSDKAAIATLAKLRTEAVDTYKLTGTPGFIINGATQDGVFTWEQLEPKLKAALS
jgi:protein-disulfide isomerase